MLNTLRGKLIGGFGVMVLLLLIGGITGLYGSYKLSTLLHFATGPVWAAADGAMEAEIGIQSQLIALSRMHAGDRGFESMLGEGEFRTEAAFDRLFSSDQAGSERIQQLRRQISAFEATRSQVQEDIYNGALVADLTDKATALLDTLSKIAAENNQQLRNQRNSVEGTVAALDAVLIAVPAVSILIALLIVVFVVSKSIRNVEAVTGVAKHIAGGNLRPSGLKIESRDEIGELQRAIEDMRKLLAASIGDVKSSSDQLAAAAEEMSLITKEAGENIEEQRRQTDTLGGAVSQMTASFKTVADNTNEAKNLAETAQKDALSGQEVVGNTVTVIGQLSSNVLDASRAIEELSQDSARIGNVLDVIRGVADQTNLLALNAAIEAARAGDMGRGFAVVADEVRTLAQRTQESTYEIQEVIAHLQQQVEVVVGVMEGSKAQASSSSDQVIAAGESLQSICSKIQSLNAINTQIASEAREQAQAADTVNENITRISDIANLTSTSSEQINRASFELSKLANNLSDLTSRFQV